MVLRMPRDIRSLWFAWLAAVLLLAGLDAASARGWQLLNMKSDWKVVFPFELAK